MLYAENEILSIDTHGKCVVLYDKKGCSGKSFLLKPGVNGNNLARLDFDNTLSSISPCYYVTEDLGIELTNETAFTEDSENATDAVDDKENDEESENGDVDERQDSDESDGESTTEAAESSDEDFQSVGLYKEIDLKGNLFIKILHYNGSYLAFLLILTIEWIMDLELDGCKNLVLGNNEVSSFDTKSGCVVLYEDNECTGRSLLLK